MNGTRLTCGITNTYRLQPGQVYYIDSPAGRCNLRNVGGGNVWYRMDGQDAAVDDPACAMLPSGLDDYDVPFHSALSFVVDKKDTTLVVRCY